jgi:hypothetical protein
MIFPPLFIEYSLAAQVSLAILKQRFSHSQTTAPLSIPETINVSFDLVNDGVHSDNISLASYLRDLIIGSSLYQYFQLSNRQIISHTIAYCSQLVNAPAFPSPLFHPPTIDDSPDGIPYLSTLQTVITLAVDAGPYCTADTLLLKRLQLQAFLLDELPGLSHVHS